MRRRVPDENFASMQPRKRPAPPPRPPPAARARQGEGVEPDGGTDAPASTRINPVTGLPYGVALLPPAPPAPGPTPAPAPAPPRYQAFACPSDGKRVSAGRGHATPADAARARDRAAIALLGRAAFEPGGGGGKAGGGGTGRARALNYPLASYPATADFKREGPELKAFLKALAKSGPVPRPRPPGPPPSRCGACDACRRPWFKHPCAAKKKAAGGGGGGRAGATPPPPAFAGRRLSPDANPGVAIRRAEAAAAHRQAVATEAAAALVTAAQARARAARAAAAAPTIDPSAWENPYGDPPAAAAGSAHDYGADLATAAAAAEAGRAVLLPRPGAARARVGGKGHAARPCALCGRGGHGLASCPVEGVLRAEPVSGGGGD